MVGMDMLDPRDQWDPRDQQDLLVLRGKREIQEYRFKGLLGHKVRIVCSYSSTNMYTVQSHSAK